MAILQQFQGVIGIVAILALVWALSEDRRGVPSWRWTAAALAAQLALALLIVRVPFMWSVMRLANGAVAAVEQATLAGSSYMFGYLGGAELPFALKDDAQPPLIIAFQILPLVIVFSALAALFWHWRILPLIVRGLSKLLQKGLGVSGVVGLMGGTSLFLGVVEAPLVIRAYLERMSRAELFQVMVLAMSTISGAILILYATTLSDTLPDAVGHMIAASIISLPAALLVARLMVPGGGATAEDRDAPGLKYAGTLDAIVQGTMDGLKLFLAVIAVIIVIFALVALADQMLALLPFVDGEALSVKRIFGWLFAPIMWAVGVGWSDAQTAGALMGTKAILNEYVAYLELAALPEGTLTGRNLIITTYALCGVANLASIGLLVSTIGTLSPGRRAEAAGLGLKSWIAGNAATLMTAAVVGIVTPVV
ncbi:MAG: nucleoside transporter C-terminal domain-containing protein [Pacificimonas sp.]